MWLRDELECDKAKEQETDRGETEKKKEADVGKNMRRKTERKSQMRMCSYVMNWSGEKLRNRSQIEEKRRKGRKQTWGRCEGRQKERGK